MVSYNGNLFIATSADTASSDNQPGTSGGASNWAGVSPGSSFAWLNNIINAVDTSTYYLAPLTGGPFDSPTQTPGVGALESPASCTVRSLTVHAIVQATDYSPDATTYVVRHNGSNTPMSCTVTMPAYGTGVYACTSTNSFFVAAGDTLEYSVTQTNSNPYIFYSTLLVCN